MAYSAVAIGPLSSSVPRPIGGLPVLLRSSSKGDFFKLDGSTAGCRHA